MKEKILDFIKANPGTKLDPICRHVGRGACDRLVDKYLQQLRRSGAIVFRSSSEGAARGWYEVKKP